MTELQMFWMIVLQVDESNKMFCAVVVFSLRTTFLFTYLFTLLPPRLCFWRGPCGLSHRRAVPVTAPGLCGGLEEGFEGSFLELNVEETEELFQSTRYFLNDSLRRQIDFLFKVCSWTTDQLQHFLLRALFFPTNMSYWLRDDTKF